MVYSPIIAYQMPICLRKKEGFEKAIMLQTLFYNLQNISELYNNTSNHMQEAVRNASQRLALEQRRQGREDLFARNRRYLEMSHKINQTRPNTVNFVLKIYERTSTSTLIKVLASRRYDRTRIMEYVGMLWNEEIVRVYEGLAALLSFGEQVVNYETQEEFLGSGVVSRLVSLTYICEHPFIQQKSLQLLKQIALAITIDNLQAFFNLTTIPLSFLIESIRLPKPAFNMLLLLLDALQDRSVFFKYKNENIPILDRIDDCISACFTSSQEKGKKAEIAADLGRFSRLLNKIKAYLHPRCVRFFNRFYQIKRRIVSFYRRESLSQQISAQIVYVEEKHLLRRIANLIKRNNKNAQIVIDYIRDLVEAGIEANLMSTYEFGCLLYDLLSSKQMRHLFPYSQLFGRVEAIIRTEFHNQKWFNSLEGWIIIITDLLNQGEDEFFELFLSKQQLLCFFGKCYEAKQQYRVVKSLNSLVRVLITHSSKEGVTEALCRHNLISKYFKNSCHFNSFAIQNQLRFFKHTLSSLKEQNMSQYEAIRKVVVDEDIYTAILGEKHYIDFFKEDQFFKFYVDLREEERLKQSDGNYIQDQATQVIKQPEGMAGFMPQGGEPLCSRCGRRHTQE